jgi:hypothetical protein
VSSCIFFSLIFSFRLQSSLSFLVFHFFLYTFPSFSSLFIYLFNSLPFNSGSLLLSIIVFLFYILFGWN